MQTHENYIRAVAGIVIARLSRSSPNWQEQQDKLTQIKLVYGSGPTGTRGVTFFNRWKSDKGETKPFVEVSAFGQESWVQLAGTTIHELGHVLAGWEAGHKKEWKAACEALGLRCILAGGTDYKLAMFCPDIRSAIAAIERPSDGEPVRSLTGILGKAAIGVTGCKAGIGTRGGKSRGTGSGSRLRLFQCGCQHPVKVRIASDVFEAEHKPCGTMFERV